MCLISIQLNGNCSIKIVEFFNSIESTADNPKDIEVLLHIDVGDRKMEELVEYEKKNRLFSLRILQTDLVKDYSSLWKPLNLLFQMTHPDAYFVTNLFDEIRFETKGWDTILKQYMGYYQDDIFRLRCSKYRFRNYTDFWECGFAPDSLAFYTRKWLQLSGDWNPCLGPDSFQQCVSFYLFKYGSKFSHTQYNRDIPIPNIKFSGEGAGIGLKGDKRYTRLAINTRAWFILMSHKIQQEANRRAMKLKASILTSDIKENVIIIERANDCKFLIVNMSNEIVTCIPYRLSKIKIGIINFMRIPYMLYYSGGGEESKKYKLASIWIVLSSHLRNSEKLMKRFIKFEKE